MADETPSDPVKAVEAKLSKGNWGVIGGGFGSAILAAMGWANSVKSDLSTAISKLDAAAVRLDKLEEKVDRKFDRLEGRLLDVERQVPGRNGSAALKPTN
ncbi:MAG: hypothetical protein KGO96_12650 [Elusimicrobia bacterium]|nr:hypothetical protein [Elusimicrobiota bacterium]